MHAVWWRVAWAIDLLLEDGSGRLKAGDLELLGVSWGCFRIVGVLVADALHGSKGCFRQTR